VRRVPSGAYSLRAVLAMRMTAHEGASRMPERIEAPIEAVRERIARSCASGAGGGAEGSRAGAGAEAASEGEAMRSGWVRAETKMGGWNVTRTSERKRFCGRAGGRARRQGQCVARRGPGAGTLTRGGNAHGGGT